MVKADLLTILRKIADKHAQEFDIQHNSHSTPTVESWGVPTREIVVSEIGNTVSLSYGITEDDKYYNGTFKFAPVDNDYCLVESFSQVNGLVNTENSRAKELFSKFSDSIANECKG